MIDLRSKCFPINSLESLCAYILFEAEQENPCLALASIVLGFYETALTVKRRRQHEISPAKSMGSSEHAESEDTLGVPFPVLEFSAVKSLHDKFLSLFQGEGFARSCPADRETVSFVIDTVWRSLTQKFWRDKPHLQSLYAFLTHQQLDSFGVSIAVVSACQQLEISDVHLCLSEDHSWIAFGKEFKENAECTWHGKSGDERRGCTISESTYKNSWVYLDGNCVTCENNKMELAAIIIAMNPVVETGVDSLEVITIQHRLLQHFYKEGWLKKFPVAVSILGNLSELVDLSKETHDFVNIFHAAILANREFYNNRLVYPYTYYGGYLLRNSCLRAAIWCWAEAAFALSPYSYSREDEEVYKEMYEFAVEVLPNIFKSNGEEVAEVSNDPLSFALLLKFYDNICLWEEDSHTPVLHVKWGRAMFMCLSKFSAEVRTSVKLVDRAKGENCEKIAPEKIVAHFKSHNMDVEKQALLFLSEISSFPLIWSSEDADTYYIGVLLLSVKMDALKDLLFSDRMQPAAIQLQLTAQIQYNSSQRQKSTTDETSPTEPSRKSKRRRFTTPQ